MSGPCRTREHDPCGVVYLPSMIPVLVALLLAANPAEGQVGEPPAPVPEAKSPFPEAQAPLPDATSPQSSKPAAPRQQLRILPQDSRMEVYQEFRQLYELARFEEALPYAKRVVELSEADEERDHELPIAYNNLGATQ